MPVERRMTSAEIRRKTNKPIMEKKRRERINKCLDELKNIVLRALNEESRPNKLEKADILEMTVRYLRTIRPLNAENTQTGLADISAQKERKNIMNPIVKNEYQQLSPNTDRVLPQSMAQFEVMRHHMDNMNHMIPTPAMMPSPFPRPHFPAPPMNIPGKYSPIPVSPISSASSKSPCHDPSGSPFDEQMYGHAANMQFNSSQNTPPYWQGNSIASNRTNELWSPSNSSNDSSIDFPAQSFQLKKEESYIWRPWGVAS